MRSKTLMLCLVGLFAAACGDGAGPPDTGTGQSASGDAEYTFCDCVIHPPTTDAKAKACGDLIEAMGYEQTAVKSLECKKQIPVPAGGPDACYCMTANSDDPEVMQICEDLFEDISETEMFALTRTCAAQRVR